MAVLSNWKANGLLLLVVIIIGGAIYTGQVSREPDRDKVTACAPTVERGHVIVVIDKTDLWNDAQANRLEGHVWQTVTQMVPEERLSVFSFTDKYEPGFAPLFSFCKPPSAQNADDIIKSKAFFDRNYKKQFAEPLQRVLTEVKAAEHHDCSPIMEVLFDILTRAEIANHLGATKLVIFSDMAQNSALYSSFLTQSCFVRTSTQGDPRYDTSKLNAYINQRRSMVNSKDLSASIFQVLPAKQPPGQSMIVKQQWTTFFKALNITNNWLLL